jgi:hypothetical protein
MRGLLARQQENGNYQQRFRKTRYSFSRCNRFRDGCIRMRLRRRPGAFVAFVDSFTEETFLKIECESEDLDLISYKLFDCHGGLVADSRGAQRFPDGVRIADEDGELLLFVPMERDENVEYRLYNLKGELLTCSDGQHTQIYGGLRIDGNRHLSGRPPAARNAS